MTMTTSNLYTGLGYLESNPRWHEEDSSWKAMQVARLLADFGIRPASVVDVGCGAGGVLQSLRPHVPDECTLTGYDISPVAIARCRGKENGRLSYVNADYLSLEVVPSDVILALDVVEHIEDYFSFLRALRSRGRHFVFHIPLDLHVSSVMRIQPLLEARRRVGHIHYFCRETALAVLLEAGYTPIAERYTAGSLELTSASRRSALLRLPRRALFRIAPHAAVRWLGGFSLLVLAAAAPTPGSGN